MNATYPVFWLIALAAMTVAAFQDVKHRLIPNLLVLIVLLAAVGLRVNGGFAAAGLSFVATAIVAGLLYLLADREYMGWGDAKMIAAASLLVPPQGVVLLMFCIVSAGGLLSCVYVLARLAVRHRPQSYYAAASCLGGGRGGIVQRELARIAAHKSMPYGIAILGGTFCWLLNRVIECSFATSCSFWAR